MFRASVSSTLHGEMSPSRITNGSTELAAVKLAEQVPCVKLAQRVIIMYNLQRSGKSGLNPLYHRMIALSMLFSQYSAVKAALFAINKEMMSYALIR
jgi:hypothetical protein